MIDTSNLFIIHTSCFFLAQEITISILLFQILNKMNQKTLLFFLLIIAGACNSNQDKTMHSDTLNQENDTTKARKDLKYKIDTSKQVIDMLIKRDTLLTVDLVNNKGSVRAYLSGIGKHVTIVVPVKGGDSITAQIIPDDDTANIRFNQIYIPVGKTGKYEGPFSRSISYPVTVKGDYKLIVGENLMAEQAWDGNFTCTVLIK